MKILLPSLLLAYTSGSPRVEVTGSTLGEGLAAVEARFPGLRFRIIDEQDRIRPHIRIFIAGRSARSPADRVGPADEVLIVGALSGG